MWQGILQGLMLADEERARKEGTEESRRVREEDMAFRREMFNAQILENRRQEALAVVRARREQDREVQQAINGAVAIGFDRRAADALQSSGQLGFVMRSLEAQDFSPNRISAMSEEILRQLGDRATEENVASAVVGVVERGTDLNNTRETALSIAESLLDAEGIAEIEALEEQAFQLGLETSRTTPFDISLGTGDMGTTELARIRTNILQRVSGFFPELELVSVGDGNVIAQNAPSDLALLINNMENEAFALTQRTGSDRLDPASAVLTVTNPIIELQRVAPELDVATLNQNFDRIYTVPTETLLQEFTAPVVPPPPPPADGSSEAADFMETAIERQPPRRAGGVRVPQVTPPAGFAFDPNEEID